MRIIKEITTHKAVLIGNEIHIIQKGITFEELAFPDEPLYKILADQEDDVEAIMERYEEDNRVMCQEFLDYAESII